MGEEIANQGGNTQSQQNQPQPVKNPLLNRPPNPELDIVVRKGSDKPIIETKQQRQGGTRIAEQQKEERKPSKE